MPFACRHCELPAPGANGHDRCVCPTAHSLHTIQINTLSPEEHEHENRRRHWHQPQRFPFQSLGSSCFAEQHRSLGAEVDVIELADVLSADFVSPSAYKEPSEAIATDRFIDSDGVVFIVPEYNGSYPGALKTLHRYAALSGWFR